MLTIISGESTPINFELTLSGDATGDVKVVVTIDCGEVAYRFPAQQSQGGWCAVVPECVQMSVGQYAMYIDVYMNNHVYPALEGEVQVQAPFKPTATLAAPAVAAPVATIKPPVERPQPPTATLTAQRTTAQMTEGSSVKARTITRIVRE